MFNSGRILVVDRDEEIRRFLRQGLESNSYTVYEGETGEDAIIKTATLLPEIVFIDMGLADMSAVLEHIYKTMDISIIMLLERSSPRVKLKVLETGANAYIVKSFSRDDVIMCIRDVRYQRQPHTVSPVFINGDMSVDLVWRQVTMRGKTVKLTPTEYAILYLLIKNAGKIVTNRQILDTLWEPDQIEKKRISLGTNFNNMRAKLEVNPKQPRYLLNELGVGYRLGLE